MCFFLVVRVHESRSTSSEGDPQLGKFVLSRQVNLNTPGLSQALPARLQNKNNHVTKTNLITLKVENVSSKNRENKIAANEKEVKEK